MTRASRKVILEAVASYYSGKLSEHGATPRGVDWKDAESQHVRHRQFLRLIEDDLDATLVDVGCGYGDFLPFLRGAGHRGRYIGCDVSEAMIDAARRLHGEGADRSFMVGPAPAGIADYAVASGILNVMRPPSGEGWKEYVRATIDELAAAGRRGFAFNMLSLNSDPERRRADLHYADPPTVLADCITRYGRHVALMQDYGLWEFTVLVRQPSSQTARPNPVAP
ncbi:MAG: class I SAM-dependent methyltransferase [Caulobacteraceae bacterium]|nr:class I SAM-dependent methyltransferase [Caulobacteraceae bacterium]